MLGKHSLCRIRMMVERAAIGATGRQSALVGALFAWWAVALVPLVHAVRPLPSKGAAVAVAAIGAVAVAVMARTGGIASTGGVAWLVAAAVAVVSFGLALAVVQVLSGRAGDDVDAPDGDGVSATP